MTKEIVKFDLLTDELSGKTLLEASAGTGKTYSVAMLSLRLIVEKGLKVEELLLVTFTNAATDELKSRVREFILQALAYRKNGTKADDNIQQIVDQVAADIAQERLLRAKDSLDQLQVFTIHSFLFLLMQEFAFETKQRFSYELIQNESDFIQDCVKDYWRKYISTKSEEEMRPLLWPEQAEGIFSKPKPLSFGRFYEVVKALLEGKRMAEGIYQKDPISWSAIPSIVARENKELKVQRVQVSFDNYFSEHEHELDAIDPNQLVYDKPSDGDKAVSVYDESRLVFFDKVHRRIKSPKWPVLTSEMLREEHLDLIDAVFNDYRDFRADKEKEILLNHTLGVNYVINSMAYECTLEIKTALKQMNEDEGIKSSDDLINDVYNLLEDKVLVEELQIALSDKYKAIFIDEFQDTDPKQSAIFTSLFSDEVVQYFVGDPKQSIYQFRGADLESYLRFQAKADLKVKSLSVNYRSDHSFVEDCNHYFTRQGDHFFQKEGVRYVQVDSNNKRTEGHLNFIEFDTDGKDTVIKQLVLHLLSQEKHIGKEGTLRQVEPKDLAVLVRTKKEGNHVKEILDSIKVPSVVLASKSVFETAECIAIETFCELLLSRSTFYFKKLLTISWFMAPQEEIRDLDLAKIDEQLQDIYIRLDEKGFYASFKLFYEEFQIKDRLRYHPNIQRILTNTEQLLEICHEWILEEKLSVYGVKEKLKKVRLEGEENEAYEERIESDDPAVKILTVHKSKGLEFNMVISTDMPYKATSSHDWAIYKLATDSGEQIITQHFNKGDINSFSEQINAIKKEELYRLEYVAVTRAKHSFYGVVPQGKIKDIIPFIRDENQAIQDTEIGAYDTGYSEMYEYEQHIILMTDQIDRSPAYRVSSFSDISDAAHGYVPREPKELQGYDQFIFNDLKKGADAGNLIHELFEFHDFDTGDIQASVDRVVDRYPSYLINQENKEQFEVFMQHVLRSEIPGLNGFSLDQLKNKEKVCELAFHWKVEGFNKEEVEELLKDDEVKMKYGVKGYLKGFIDFIFEHEGKYYILDWKSNHIGYDTSDYGQEEMNEAMKANGYHLQHYIYKQAFMTYLGSLYPEKSEEELNQLWGGVVYVFVRGCREGEEYGVFRY